MVVAVTDWDYMRRSPQTFDEWWKAYKQERGLVAPRLALQAARAAWEAAARQNIPGYVTFALTAAQRHTGELREAWQRGIIDERDGQGGTRSNRNVDVEVGVRKALELLCPKP
jgi:hypothetical protein